MKLPLTTIYVTYPWRSPSRRAVVASNGGGKLFFFGLPHRYCLNLPDKCLKQNNKHFECVPSSAVEHAFVTPSQQLWPSSTPPRPRRRSFRRRARLRDPLSQLPPRRWVAASHGHREAPMDSSAKLPRVRVPQTLFIQLALAQLSIKLIQLHACLLELA